ncbi:MAG: 50S ribosomal protein L28 [Bdellovibrionales bacterium GWB1_55_8]|nr:MAG: 50S ribosomal protein L28 [Bdellovibrionales bacterium GWB1_55_8]
MARVCEFCDKGPVTGHQVSHSNIKTKTRWLPNLKRMRAVIDGTTRTVRVCTRCIRTGLVTRPLKRTFKPEAAKNA